MHSGNRGDALEHSFRGFLDDHTSRELEVGHGEVIDRFGNHAGSTNRDGQIDCLLVDPRHPRFSKTDTPSTYVIDGILLAGEIKMSLGTNELRHALAKARDFKRLQARIPRGDMVIANDSDGPRFYDRRPFFIFSYESKLTEEKIHEAALHFMQCEDLNHNHFADAIFLLDRKSLINFGDGKGQLQMTSGGKSVKGWGLTSTKTMYEFIRWVYAVYPKFARMGDIFAPYMLSP